MTSFIASMADDEEAITHSNEAFDEDEGGSGTDSKRNSRMSNRDSWNNNRMSDRRDSDPDAIKPANGDVDPQDAKIEFDEEEMVRRKREREVLHFRNDTSKRIDYVLVYDDLEDEKKVKRRAAFEKNLKNEGIDIEQETKKDSVDGKSYFVKLHVEWDTMCKVADLLYLPKRIKMPKSLEEELGGCCASCVGPLEVGPPIVPDSDDYFTAEFDATNMDMFDIDPNNQEAFFTNAERSLVAKEVLDRTSYTEMEEGIQDFGINRLLKDAVYTAAYPLHEGPVKSLPGDETPWEGEDKTRSRLYEAWARPGRWYCFQPLDMIRDYFGEKVAIYFSWLGFYTAMLIPAAFVGTGVFVYGAVTMFSYIPSDEICDAGASAEVVMCPLCDTGCQYWRLKDSCVYSRLTYLFDNEATVAFAVFMAIWATIFLEFWKRKQKSIEYDWDVADYELEEPMRPEFEYRVRHKRKNPITMEEEPYMPWYSAIPRNCTSLSIVVFWLCLVIGAIFGVIIYRIIVAALIYKVEPNETIAKLGTSISASVINLVIIVILNFLYTRIAEKLTDLETPRTWTEYEDSFTFKMFLFQFVNFYGTIFYIAFFKGRFNSVPNDSESYLFGRWRQDSCDPSGCLVDLFIQLAIVMIGKQTFNNAKELFIPLLLAMCRARSSKKGETEENLYMRWEQDKDLGEQPKLGLFDEYLEMVIQFGFVTIFVAAFPLAPLFALMNNVIEVRLDAYKFACVFRRAPALKAQDIGVWYGILKGISFISVITNAFIIGWTSDFIPKLVYLYNNHKDLTGYIDHSLSRFSVADYTNSTRPDSNAVPDGFEPVNECRYRGYYHDPSSPEKYEYTIYFWWIFTARLAFIICFEHAVFLLTWLVSYIIPDVPAGVKRLMLYERELIKKLRFDATFGPNKKANQNGHAY